MVYPKNFTVLNVTSNVLYEKISLDSKLFNVSYCGFIVIVLVLGNS